MPNSPLDRITQAARDIIERHKPTFGFGEECDACCDKSPCPDRVAAERILVAVVTLLSEEPQHD
jgi:hypothetical protein